MKIFIGVARNHILQCMVSASFTKREDAEKFIKNYYMAEPGGTVWEHEIDDPQILKQIQEKEIVHA